MNSPVDKVTTVTVSHQKSPKKIKGFSINEEWMKNKNFTFCKREAHSPEAYERKINFKIFLVFIIVVTPAKHGNVGLLTLGANHNAISFIGLSHRSLFICSSKQIQTRKQTRQGKWLEWRAITVLISRSTKNTCSQLTPSPCCQRRGAQVTILTFPQSCNWHLLTTPPIDVCNQQRTADARTNDWCAGM